MTKKERQAAIDELESLKSRIEWNIPVVDDGFHHKQFYVGENHAFKAVIMHIDERIRMLREAE